MSFLHFLFRLQRSSFARRFLRNARLSNQLIHAAAGVCVCLRARRPHTRGKVCRSHTCPPPRDSNTRSAVLLCLWGTSWTDGFGLVLTNTRGAERAWPGPQPWSGRYSRCGCFCSAKALKGAALLWKLSLIPKQTPLKLLNGEMKPEAAKGQKTTWRTENTVSVCSISSGDYKTEQFGSGMAVAVWCCGGNCWVDKYRIILRFISFFKIILPGFQVSCWKNKNQQSNLLEKLEAVVSC